MSKPISLKQRAVAYQLDWRNGDATPFAYAGGVFDPWTGAFIARAAYHTRERVEGQRNVAEVYRRCGAYDAARRALAELRERRATLLKPLP